MALRHRKLFPALTATNETTNCGDLCDPACSLYSYNCNPLPDVNLNLPPIFSPPPPLSTAHHSISPYMIVLISVLVSFFLVISYYVIIAKSCAGWCGSSTTPDPGHSQSDGTEEESIDDNRISGGLDHPIWFITRIGLQQSVINSITVCKYKKGEGLIEGTDCSVCLSEFQEDETLRILPKCSHAFHISCIDTWLRSHTNCPLCRAHIVTTEIVGSDVLRLPVDSSLTQSYENVSFNGQRQTENPEIDGELLGEHQVIIRIQDTEEEEGNNNQTNVEEISKEVLNDPVGNCGNHTTQGEEEEEQEQVIRKRVLVDSSSSAIKSSSDDQCVIEYNQAS